MKALSIALSCFCLLAGSALAEPAKAPTMGARTDFNDAAAVAIRDVVAKRYAGEKYPHRIEDILTALGADAGYGCQMAIREGFIKTGKISEGGAFIVVGTKDGSKYYFGEFLNGCLVGAKRDKGPISKGISVWSLVAGAAEHAGAERYPDIREIQRHDAQTAGSAAFGMPQLPAERMPDEMPIDALRATWPQVRQILTAHGVEPRFWGWVCATAAQQVIIGDKSKLDPSMSARIVMESALPMASVDGPAAGVR